MNNFLTGVISLLGKVFSPLINFGSFIGTAIPAVVSWKSLTPNWRKLFIVVSIPLIIGIIVGSLLPSVLHPAPRRTLSHTTLVPHSTTIEIASEFPTSDYDKFTGLPLQNAVQMAIDDANNNQILPKGYSLKLTSYNDVGKGNRSDPDVGVNNLNQAIKDNLVAGVIGPYYSSVAAVELPIANKAPIALISPSTTYDCLTNDVDCSSPDPDKSKMRPTGKLTFFQLATIGSQVGKAAADYFISVRHHKNVVLIADVTDYYIKKLADGFQQEGEYILPGSVNQLRVPGDGSDPQTYLQSAIPFHPDLIYFVGRDVDGVDALLALSKIPALKDVPFAGDGNIADAYFLNVAARIHPSAPVYANVPFQDPAHSGTPEGKTFERDYERADYTDYRFHAASAYAATTLLIQAINTALQKGVSTPHGPQDQTGGSNFRQAVLSVLTGPNFTSIGITGKHTFDANGDTTNHTVSFYQLDLSGQQPTWTWIHQTDNA